jgi:hypothetical protein
MSVFLWQARLWAAALCPLHMGQSYALEMPVTSAPLCRWALQGQREQVLSPTIMQTE